MKKRPLFLLIMAVMSILTALVISNCSANLDDIREVYENALLNSTPSSSSNSERLGWCVYLDRPGKKCFSNIPEAVGCPSDAFSGVGIMVPGPVPECFSSSSSGTKGSSSSGTSPSYCLRATEKVCIAPTDGECLPGTTPDYSEECPYSSSSGGGSSSSGGSISSSSGDGSSSSGDGSSSSMSSSSGGGIITDPDVTFERDMFLDQRDGKIYKYEIAPATLGGRVWMSENMDYSKGGTIGYCYKTGLSTGPGTPGESGSGCNTPYGRNYTYAVATDGELSLAKARGICPKGWHIPDSTEWQQISPSSPRMSTDFYVLSGNYDVPKSSWQNRPSVLGGTGGGFYWYSNARYKGDSIGFTLIDAWGASANIEVRTKAIPTNPDKQLSKDDDNFSVRCIMDETSLPTCGASSFDPTTDFCSNNQIYPRCGGKTFNPATEECSGTTIVSRIGTFIDTRESKTYKWVKIGTQKWMAENLNFDPGTGNSACYNSNCSTYGRYYDWATAMGISLAFNTTSFSAGPNHPGICPFGWRIPSDADWDALMTAVGGSSTAGKHLKATNGWGSGNGLDTYGFSALPGGYGSSSGYFYGVGNYGYWWSASEYASGNAYTRDMGYGHEYVGSYGSKSSLFSVRCVQD